MSRRSGKIRLANTSDDLRPCSGLRLTCAPITRSHTWRQGSGRATPTRWDLWKHEIPPPQNSELPKKNSEPPKIFSEPPSFFSEPRKIFSEPPSLGEPFSSFYRDTSEYAFCRNPIPYTGATALSSRAAWSAPRQHLRTRSSALRISAATGVARQTPSHATRRHGSSSRAARPAPQQNLHTRSKSLRINMTLDAPRRAQNPTPHPHGGGQKDRKTPGKAEKK